MKKRIPLLFFTLFLLAGCASAVNVDVSDKYKSDYDAALKSRFYIRFDNSSENIKYTFKVFRDVPHCTDPNNCLGYFTKIYGITSSNTVRFDEMPTGIFFGMLSLESSGLAFWNYSSANLTIFFGYSVDLVGGKEVFKEYTDSKCVVDRMQRFRLICPKMKIEKDSTTLSFKANDRKVSGSNTLALWTSGPLLPLFLILYGPVGFEQELEYQGAKE
ncbi:hypothetical protein CH371_05700 [Leptospira wolffii]|uniref:Lipoprotein n=1 Tax=Leptospira wolffii TaxID=409998 RepID=A0A2M9ZGG3_9LEPT|nr:hypothetical protein [Leptospira wolffii]PJZ67511.1 hypothetical protein CH371_05700 [Leptospira wolffii]